jgi:hypothetical protein
LPRNITDVLEALTRDESLTPSRSSDLLQELAVQWPNVEDVLRTALACGSVSGISAILVLVLPSLTNDDGLRERFAKDLVRRNQGIDLSRAKRFLVEIDDNTVKAAVDDLYVPLAVNLKAKFQDFALC